MDRADKRSRLDDGDDEGRRRRVMVRSKQEINIESLR